MAKCDLCWHSGHLKMPQQCSLLRWSLKVLPIPLNFLTHHGHFSPVRTHDL